MDATTAPPSRRDFLSSSAGVAAGAGLASGGLLSGCASPREADEVAAIVLCQTDRVDYSFVNGRKLVDQGRLTTIDHTALAERARRAAHRLSA